MTSSSQIWVRTSFFHIEQGEDELTNPGRYGRAFSHWLAEQLKTRGEEVQEVLPEDWGWCVMLARKPYMLWVGCGNRNGVTDEWGAFVTAEPSLLQKLFSRTDSESTVNRIHKTLNEIMQHVPEFEKVWIEE